MFMHMFKTHKPRGSVVLLFALVIAATVLGCVEQSEAPARELAGFSVQVTAAEFGTANNPLPFPQGYSDVVGCTVAGCTVLMDIKALRPDGSIKADFDGNVELRVVPGEIHPDDQVIKLVAGVASNVQVRFRYAFGPTRIWVEDTGIPDAGIDECSDGIDNDGNGLIDFPKDPTCGENGDRDEGTGTYVTGVSPQLYFELPSISSVQKNPDSTTGPSPLSGQYVEIQGRTGHDLVVSNVVGTGFYVTDISEQAYNSVFVFNFSFPEDVVIGDRVCEVGGGVVEFNALTQLQFPSWGIQGKLRSNAERVPTPEDEEDQLINDELDIVDCSDRYGVDKVSKTLPLPDPILLTSGLIVDLPAMERLEGSVVTIENVQLSTYFVNCDDNGSGRIESGTDESVCRSTCNDNPFCTELSSLYGYDQWRGRVQGSEISVSSTQLVSGFDVLAGCTEGKTKEGRLSYECPARSLKRVTGSLRQIVPTCDKFLPCDPAQESIVLFIIDPRFSSDIIE